MTILSGIIMFNTKKFKNVTLKIAIGLFFSVIIYYVNNFFNVMGATEKFPLIFAIWSPILFLSIANFTMFFRVNDK
jgi:lipopolysaccharide export system permease protein